MGKRVLLKLTGNLKNELFFFNSLASNISLNNLFQIEKNTGFFNVLLLKTRCRLWRDLDAYPPHASHTLCGDPEISKFYIYRAANHCCQYIWPKNKSGKKKSKSTFLKINVCSKLYA